MNVDPSSSGLFAPGYVDYAEADVVGTTDAPPADLIHRIHVVASPGPGLVTVCSSKDGWRFLPGGRLEAGEGLRSAMRRELMEEAGCEPVGEATIFFSQVATSRRATPYLPHAPHPVMWWAYASVISRIVGEPTAPADGEQIEEVLHLPAEDAVQWLAEDPGAASHCDVVRLALRLGLV